MRSLLTILGSVMLACPGLAENVGSWSGETYVPVNVRVIAEKDGKPVSGARVWLLTGRDRHAYQAAASNIESFTKANGPIERFGSRVFSDADGRTKIWSPFDAAGGVLADGSHSTFRYIQGIVVVEAGKYARFESELEALLPKDLDQKSTAPISITVRLKEAANQTPQPTPSGRG